MTHFLLEPEVAGGLGPRTQLDRTQHPPAVTSLQYEFCGWLGDALLESFPCFIVTQALADALRAVRLSGASFERVEVTVTPEFRELQPSVMLPTFQWLHVTGRAGADDFGISLDHRLVVSQAALAVIKAHPLEHCEIYPWAG